jgi:hypothetical protein
MHGKTTIKKKVENCYTNVQFIKCGISRLCFKLVDGAWMTKTFIGLSRHVRCLAFACEDRLSPLRKMVEEVEIGVGSCIKILTKNFVIWHIATKLIQRLLTVEEKLRLHRPLTAGWSGRRLMKLITVCSDTVSVNQISKGSSSLPDVSPDDFQDCMRRQSRSYMDRIFIVFFNCRCMMHSDFCP